MSPGSRPTSAANKLLSDQSFWGSSLDSMLTQIQGVFIMSLVWSFGIFCPDHKGRREYDRVLRAILMRKIDDYVAPSGETYRLDQYPAPNVSYEDPEASEVSQASLSSLGGPKSAVDIAAEGSRGSLARTKTGPPALQAQITRMKTMAKEKDKGLRLYLALPPDTKKATLFDYCWDIFKAQWKRWDTMMPTDTIPVEAGFREILVPTPDRTRYMYLLDISVKHQVPILFVGPTGTGKTRYIQEALLRLPILQYAAANMLTFSARTSAVVTQQLIDAKLDKRRKGVYGPRPGLKQVIFVDDLNMPKPEAYGAQPPIELLRQLLDYGGWYQGDNLFREVVDTTLVAAMGPTGGGRYPITQRLTRHMTVIAMTELDGHTMRLIFRSLYDWHMNRYSFPDELKNLSEALVDATLSVYESVQRHLMPTPAKMFYLFNIRDLARVFSGICLSLPQDLSVEHGSMRPCLVRLWVHELIRVFGDRLVDSDDRLTLLDAIKTALMDRLGMRAETVLDRIVHPSVGSVTVDSLRDLIFADFPYDPRPETQRPPYKEIEDLPDLVSKVERFLSDYNSMSKRPMNLAIFKGVVEHISRICRGLRMPGEHMLLVGVGGSGRQSLSRLASFVMGYDLFQVDMTKSYTQKEWREDLKKMITRAGLDGESCVFLLSDSQLQSEEYLEDINAILNSGEVPNLFDAQERSSIVDKLREQLMLKQAMAKAATMAPPPGSAAGRQRSAGTREDSNGARPSTNGSAPKAKSLIGGGASLGANAARRMTAVAGVEADMEQPMSPAEIWNQFVRRTSERLHVLFCMSPVGDKFRERLRK